MDWDRVEIKIEWIGAAVIIVVLCIIVFLAVVASVCVRSTIVVHSVPWRQFEFF